jgi:hypothetical protein
MKNAKMLRVKGLNMMLKDTKKYIEDVLIIKSKIFYILYRFQIKGHTKSW